MNIIGLRGKLVEALTRYGLTGDNMESAIREIIQWTLEYKGSENILIDALEKIEQMSDPGSYERAIINMKAIATKALKEIKSLSPTSAGESQEELWQWALNYYEGEYILNPENEKEDVIKELEKMFSITRKIN